MPLSCTSLPCCSLQPLTIYTHNLQIEGAFVMGMGLQTSEEVVVDQDSGKLLRWGKQSSQ